MPDILAARREEWARLRSRARDYLTRLSRRMPVRAAALVGSAARGDFNLWSDIDVVVVSDDLPADPLERPLALSTVAPPGVQPIGFTEQEFRGAYLRGNPFAREAVTGGVILCGEDFFRGVRADAAHGSP